MPRHTCGAYSPRGVFDDGTNLTKDMDDSAASCLVEGLTKMKRTLAGGTLEARTQKSQRQTGNKEVPFRKVESERLEKVECPRWEAWRPLGGGGGEIPSESTDPPSGMLIVY